MQFFCRSSRQKKKIIKIEPVYQYMSLTVSALLLFYYIHTIKSIGPDLLIK